ncbi:MAG: geranylgeranylglycerol-phosphate geranylgeranyltransferase [Bacteroidetes bacterium]|nr:geranylgeranylglycerol-phosphate geranylgeranyltransferase [Bacteroidota bacterium]
MNYRVYKYLAGVSGLIRLPNLLIIILTQVLLRYGVLKTILYSGDVSLMSGIINFILLMITTVLMAAAGYIINDYFDISTDTINKPDQMVMEKFIRTKTALVLYFVITGVAIIAGFFLAFRLNSVSFGMIFPCFAIMLYLYSSRYKRSFLFGNLMVAFLSAMVILMVWLSEFLFIRMNSDTFAIVLNNLKSCGIFFIGYALFAFLVSLFREIIKDIEDYKGDMAIKCSTMPIVIGIRKTKSIISIIFVVTFLLLAYGLLILFRRDMMYVFWYLIVTIQLPIIYIFYKLLQAETREDFHFLSSFSKLIMLAGILSMQLISIST